jgi:hypothetical protein
MKKLETRTMVLKKRTITIEILLIAFLVFTGCGYNRASTIDDSASAPLIGGYRVYMGHLHNHTSVSDGTGTPSEAYEYARDVAKMDFFGISDHADAISPARWTALKTVADRFNQDGVFVTFRGFEWSSKKYGHVTIINTSTYCTDKNPDADTFDELCTWLSVHNGVAFFNHPGREDTTGEEFNHFNRVPADQFAGMELWNKDNGFDVYYYNDGYDRSDNGLGYYDEALSRGWHIGASGSGDDHHGTWGTRQPFRVAVLAKEKTRAALLNAFLERRFYSTLDKNLALSFTMNGHAMGSKINPGTYDVEIFADDGSNHDVFNKIELINNGTVYQQLSPFLKRPVVTLPLRVDSGDYYYIRITQADGDAAVSSPIWIR